MKLIVKSQLCEKRRNYDDTVNSICLMVTCEKRTCQTKFLKKLIVN